MKQSEQHLELITMSDVKPEKVQFLWKPYIAYGKITIVQGDPGDGKTTMMLSIASAVTRGDSIADGVNSAPPSDVIFQNAEDGIADTIRPKLDLFGANCSRVHIIDEDKESLSIADERLEAAIVKTGARLCILDLLQNFLGGADMYSTRAMRPLMRRLKSVAERTGAAIIIMGHLNKNIGSKAAYRGVGSIDIPAAARSILTVGKLEIDENMRVFIHTKSNIVRAGKPQAFGLDAEERLVWLGEYDITIEELLGTKKESKGAGQFDLAKSFIKGLLSFGDVASAIAFSKGENAGFPQVTMKRAKSDLCVKSVKRGSEWFWISEQDQEDQEVHDFSAGETDEVRKIGLPALCLSGPLVENGKKCDALDSLDTLLGDVGITNTIV